MRCWVNGYDGTSLRAYVDLAVSVARRGVVAGWAAAMMPSPRNVGRRRGCDGVAAASTRRIGSRGRGATARQATARQDSNLCPRQDTPQLEIGQLTVAVVAHG